MDKGDVAVFSYILIGVFVVLFLAATQESVADFRARDTSDHGYKRSEATIEAYWEERARGE